MKNQKNSVAEKVKEKINQMICKAIGHKIVYEAYINKDEGYEKEMCKRCSYEKYNYVN